MRRVTLIVLVRAVNVPRHICQHTVGKHHSHRHRMAVGAVVMVAGVCLALQAGHYHNVVAHVAFDLVGYGIHGFGLMPYLEYVLEKFGELE